MMTCREVSELNGTGQIEEAGVLTRVKVRLHLLMCRHCPEYARQLRIIPEQARVLFDRDVEDETGLAERVERRVLADGEEEERD
ncbi:MAG: hypothetical protein R6W82_01570 [bacterium]